MQCKYMMQFMNWSNQLLSITRTTSMNNETAQVMQLNQIVEVQTSDNNCV